jgi:hypothetical protein
MVIAVIATLVALLLPALARAKEKGRQTYCINSDRQQAHAVYADDDGEVLPPVAYRAQNGNITNWPAMLDPYLKSTRVHICPSDPTGNPIKPIRPRAHFSPEQPSGL